MRCWRTDLFRRSGVTLWRRSRVVSVELFALRWAFMVSVDWTNG
jgi:hypothetical protein